jgi:cytochrome c oxidase subunit 2
VLHDFFVPDMRVKHDIVPGRYTEVWFTPTVLGKHHVTCAEYCGKGHSDMTATLVVDNEPDFKKWLETGGDDWKNYPPEKWGEMQREQKGCATCHSIDGSKGQGPTWKGIYGTMVEMSDGKSYLVDDAYLQESMLQPNAKIVKGFEAIMPSFQGLLHPQDIRGLIAYIKTLK